MRNLDMIVKEIVELTEIKSACNHYLSSHRSLTEVENTTQIQKNREITCNALRILKAELLQAKAAIKMPEMQRNNHTRYTKVVHTPLQIEAIMHFNSDRRFTITE